MHETFYEIWQRNHQYCCSDNLHSSTNKEDPQHALKMHQREHDLALHYIIIVQSGAK